MTLFDVLDRLRGHRTHALVFVCTVSITVRYVLLPAEQFVAGLSDYAMLLVGVAGVLLGSKAGEALKERLRAK